MLQSDHHQPAELMFSMTFLSSAERLTIVITKARNLRLDDAKNVPSESTQVLFTVTMCSRSEHLTTKCCMCLIKLT